MAFKQEKLYNPQCDSGKRPKVKGIGMKEKGNDLVSRKDVNTN